MTDNKKIAEQVLAAVGGAANLKDATHCMTRLRLYLKDDSLPKDREMKKDFRCAGCCARRPAVPDRDRHQCSESV